MYVDFLSVKQLKNNKKKGIPDELWDNVAEQMNYYYFIIDSMAYR